MKGTKCVGTVLAVVVMVLVFASVVSAQSIPDILHGQWFKIKLGVKGYKITGDTVLGKGSGSVSAYLHFDYSADSPGSYTVYTCTQNDLNPASYTLNLDGTVISLDDIYGETYPQVWDFGGTPLVFKQESNVFTTYPTFYTKVTATGDTLKNASISNVACSLYADLVEDDQGADYATGSCSISGPLVSAANVAKGKVPDDCTLR